MKKKGFRKTTNYFKGLQQFKYYIYFGCLMHTETVQEFVVLISKCQNLFTH